MNYTFRILYAIAMIMVVAGHCMNGGISFFYEWFPPYAVHLAVFMFSSGYFYKDSVEENGKVDYIWKKVKKLIVPLYLWNFFYALITLVASWIGYGFVGTVNLYTLFIAPITDGHQFTFNLGGWFVIPLFMVQVYNVFLRGMWKKVFKKINEYILFVFNMLMGILGVYIASIGFNTGWWLVLVRMLYFIPFYSLGILYNRKIERMDRVSNITYFSVVLILQLFLIEYYKTPIVFVPSWCNDFVYGPIVPYVIGFLGIAFWLRIAKILEPAIGRSKCINLIAGNTYSIMINHFLGFFILNTVFAVIHICTGLLGGFDLVSYKYAIYYVYLPNDIDNFLIVYLVVGIAIPILMQKVIDYAKKQYGMVRN